jgi:hypothetical protein
MGLNSEQNELKNQLLDFINSKQTGFFGVLGAGGCGKTYTICKCIENKDDFIFLGATNKVVSVLGKGLRDNDIYVDRSRLKTVDSFLSFKMEKDHNNRTIIKHRLPKLDKIPAVIVIDEISLLRDSSLEYLLKLKNKRKFILIGDDRQIPPIEEDYYRNEAGFKCSNIFKHLDKTFTLTIQNRQKTGSDLYALISGFRGVMDKRFSYEEMAKLKANNIDVLYFDINDPQLKKIIKGENPIAVCYKNLTVLSFSWLIGSTKSNVVKGYKVNDINIGDTVFFDGYYKYKDDIFYTSETIQVIDIDNYVEEILDVGDIKPCIFNYKIVQGKKESGAIVNVRVGNGYNETLQPIKYRIDRVVQKLKDKANETNNRKYKWALLAEASKKNTEYNDFKNGFATLKKPFAITCYKAQGSTYEDVIIPIYDYSSKEPQDAAQLLYVAMSRAKKRIIFVNRKSNLKDNNNRYSFTELERFSILSSQNYKCNICDIDLETGRDFDIDHVTPLANGGKNSANNLQAICKDCHKEKTKNEKYEKAI